MLTGENDEPDINELSFTELRDKLLALDPLDTDHVIKWVSENCFPGGSLAKPSVKDLEFLERPQKLVESEGIPAPAPVEQRKWLTDNKHLKYLWITVVVVTCNPVSKWRGPPKYGKDEALQYVHDLYLELGKKYRVPKTRMNLWQSKKG
ncbi:hypothetical protein MKW98_026706 [Papaver atlanticum]|uniref:Uncharacterized protein n=1 Tax=Papaver atlanticum TaxID=357466 RepID=A0AAD4S0T1_9MAGN|nr:hypothetical protein MKW98_026706 [Papaver atlanticum]